MSIAMLIALNRFPVIAPYDQTRVIIYDLNNFTGFIIIGEFKADQTV